MIREVKIFQCEFDNTPTDEDLSQSLKVAKESNCIIELQWILKWSGRYQRRIYPEDTIEKIRESLPKIYGM